MNREQIEEMRNLRRFGSEHFELLWQVSDLALEALSLRELVKEVLKLKPRWDHHGAFYKPSDVDPILEKLRAASGGGET